MIKNSKTRRTFEYFRDATLLLGSTATVMSGTLIAPSLPQMSVIFRDVPNSDFLIRLLLTIHALFIAFSAPFCGILLDRWGRKPVLILSMILYGIAGASGFVLDSLYAILVSRALLGVAVAGIMSGFTTLIGDYFSGSKLNSFMGLQAAFLGFGSVILFIIGGIAADIGWRYPFLLYLTIVFILPGVVLFVYEPETKMMKTPGSLKASMPIRNLLEVYFLSFTGMAIFYMIPVQIPFYLKLLENVSNTKIGVAISVSTLFAAIISKQYHKFKNRLSFQGIFVVFFLFMGSGYLVIASAASYYNVVLGLAVSGTGLGLLIPNVNVWVVSLVPSEIRGRAVGGLTTCFLVGQFFSPIMTQPVIEDFGIGGSFGIVGGMALFFAGYCVMSAHGIYRKTK